MWTKWACANMNPDIKRSDFSVADLSERFTSNNKLYPHLSRALKIASYVLTGARITLTTVNDYYHIMNPDAPQKRNKIFNVVSVIISILQSISINITAYNRRIKSINADSTFISDLLHLRFTGDIGLFESQCDELFNKETDGYFAYDFAALFCIIHDLIFELKLNKFLPIFKKLVPRSPYRDQPSTFRDFLTESASNASWILIEEEKALKYLASVIDTQPAIDIIRNQDTTIQKYNALKAIFPPDDKIETNIFVVRKSTNTRTLLRYSQGNFEIKYVILDPSRLSSEDLHKKVKSIMRQADRSRDIKLITETRLKEERQLRIIELKKRFPQNLDNEFEITDDIPIRDIQTIIDVVMTGNRPLDRLSTRSAQAIIDKFIGDYNSEGYISSLNLQADYREFNDLHDELTEEYTNLINLRGRAPPNRQAIKTSKKELLRIRNTIKKLVRTDNVLYPYTRYEVPYNIPVSQNGPIVTSLYEYYIYALNSIIDVKNIQEDVSSSYNQTDFYQTELEETFRKFHKNTAVRFRRNMSATTIFTLIKSLYPVLKFFGVFIPQNIIDILFNERRLTEFFDEQLGVMAGVLLGPDFLIHVRFMTASEEEEEQSIFTRNFPSLENRMDPILDDMITNVVTTPPEKYIIEEEPELNVLVDYDAELLGREISRLRAGGETQPEGETQVIIDEENFERDLLTTTLNQSENLSEKSQEEINHLEENPTLRGSYVGLMAGKVLPNTITTRFKTKIHRTLCKLSANSSVAASMFSTSLNLLLALSYLSSRMTAVVFDSYMRHRRKIRGDRIEDFCQYVSPSNRSLIRQRNFE